MEQQTHFAPIPQPKPDPILKNLKDLDAKNPVQGLMRLARTCQKCGVRTPGFSHGGETPPPAGGNT